MCPDNSEIKKKQRLEDKVAWLSQVSVLHCRFDTDDNAFDSTLI